MAAGLDIVAVEVDVEGVISTLDGHHLARDRLRRVEDIHPSAEGVILIFLGDEVETMDVEDMDKTHRRKEEAGELTLHIADHRHDRDHHHASSVVQARGREMVHKDLVAGIRSLRRKIIDQEPEVHLLYRTLAHHLPDHKTEEDAIRLAKAHHLIQTGEEDEDDRPHAVMIRVVGSQRTVQDHHYHPHPENPETTKILTLSGIYNDAMIHD